MSGFTSGDVVTYAYENGYLDPNINQDPIPSNRDEILNTMITSVIINIEPLGEKYLKYIRGLLRGISKILLPSKFSIAGLSHASIYIPIQDNQDEGVWIEYGAYDNNRSGDFKGQVHYLNGQSGLRFAKMTKKEYDDRALNAGVNFAYINCHVRHQMTIGKLLQIVSENNKWTKGKYVAILQNCQRFVDYSITVLGAYRTGFSFYSEDKATIPFGILETLNKNSLDSESDNLQLLKQIPIFGAAIDKIVEIIIKIEQTFMKKDEELDNLDTDL